MAKASSQERMNEFHERLGYFLGQKSLREFEDDHFRATVADILLRIVRYAFNARPDGTFYPVLKVIYKDSSWMVTIGGFFAGRERATVLFESGTTK